MFSKKKTLKNSTKNKIKKTINTNNIKKQKIASFVSYRSLEPK